MEHGNYIKVRTRTPDELKFSYFFKHHREIVPYKLTIFPIETVPWYFDPTFVTFIALMIFLLSFFIFVKLLTCFFIWLASAFGKLTRHFKAKRIMASLTSGKFGQIGETYGSHCVICLEEFLESDKITKLPCRHILHQRCASHYLEMENKCPCCKVTVFAQSDYEQLSENSSRQIV